MIHTVAGNGKEGFSGDGSLAIHTELNWPEGIALSSNGEIYIADTRNHRIRKVALNGLISTIAGNGKGGFSGDGSLATNARLHSPAGIAVSLSGEVYIADTWNHRIRKVASNGLISTIAGDILMGFGVDNGLAIDAQLRNPHSITISPNGDVYIADTGNNRIRKVTPGGLISIIAGNGEEGFSGDGGPATNAQLDGPVGVAVSESGEIYIADRRNHRIRKVAPNGLISTIAGNGEKGFGGDGGLATKAQLSCPQGIAVGSNGKIYIADSGNRRIRKVSKNGFISTIAGNDKGGFIGGNGEQDGFIGGYGEQDGFIGDEGLATKAQLNRPHGVAVGSDGAVYIVDSLDCRIRKIDGLCPNGMVRGTSLKKYERDHALDNLVCFQPLLAKLAPTFYEFVLSAKTHLNANEKHIVQQLIDSLIYGAELDLDDLESATMVDWFFVLSMIEGGEFLEVKRQLTSEFMNQLDPGSIPVVLERLDTLRERNMTENQLLSQMTDYTLGRAALALRSSSTLSANPIIQRHSAQILSKVCQSEPAPILLSETNREETGGIQSLFNDSTTGDIKILLGEKQWYCHRTILSSRSPYFEALFSNGQTFNDLVGDTYRIDCTEFGEGTHELIIKYCYSLLDESAISVSEVIPLLKCASFYGMSQLADSCANGINLSTGNYFELIEQLGEYPCEVLCTKLVEFGFLNAKSLNMTQEKLFSLPEQIKQQLFWKCMQEQVRK